MAERQPPDQQHPLDQQLQSPPPLRENMMACVMALEAALLPCLPARELQAIDRSPHPSHQIHKLHTRKVNMNIVFCLYGRKGEYLVVPSVDVERHARDFMEVAKRLQLYFIGLQQEDQPTKEETLRKEIAVIEEELKIKSEIIKKHERLIQGWRKELKEQLDKHITELERV
ncbi:hypothetical protein HHK36_000982 [Tetracentron sinense]|uniref:Mediator of RNA polymerase II transcription subunit 28 n=1 Tax=Tetracentron sinense TaxID=13715 RepID=A0A834ZS10_TETSI|nr:hypothetical protein HHK36_000982 [Tetracentron sinense]